MATDFDSYNSVAKRPILYVIDISKGYKQVVNFPSRL